MATGRACWSSSAAPPSAIPLHDQLNFLQVRALERLGRIEEALAALARRREALEAAGRQDEALLVQASAALLAARNDRAAIAVELAAQVLAGASRRPNPRSRSRCACCSPTSSSSARIWRRRWLRSAMPGARAAASPSATSSPCARTTPRRPPRYRERLASGALAQAPGARRRGRAPRAFQEALPLLDRALAADPASSELRFRQATALERTGRVRRVGSGFRGADRRGARPRCRRSTTSATCGSSAAPTSSRGSSWCGARCALDPNNGAYVDSLGWGLYRLGRFAEASDVLERAARLMPNDSTVLEHLGDSLLALGALDRARDAYRRALALGPDGTGGLAAKLAGPAWGLLACAGRALVRSVLLGLAALAARLPSPRCAVRELRRRPRQARRRGAPRCGRRRRRSDEGQRAVALSGRDLGRSRLGEPAAPACAGSTPSASL